MNNCKNELLSGYLCKSNHTYFWQTCMHDSGYLVVVTKNGSNNFSNVCMARDLRHPYIPSTTVLGDIVVLQGRESKN